jgi:hypothetical protein
MLDIRRGAADGFVQLDINQPRPRVSHCAPRD